jgi:hypothetical protein
MPGHLLDEKIIRLNQAFTRDRVPHAFGGALALAYYAVPRATIDIDVNVFLRGDAASRVLDPLAELGVSIGGEARSLAERDGQVRVWWEHTPVDLFFSYDPLHESAMRRIRRVPFADRNIPVLSAGDLVIFKVIFDRSKDWRDIAEVLASQGPRFEAAYAREWLAKILDEDDPRRRKLEDLLAEHGPS